MTDSLDSFETITLEEMDSVKMMNRTDTKFVAPLSLLGEILSRASSRYFVLETEGSRTAPYVSMYYDTPSLEMYTRHHDGRLVRRKVRTRTYLNSGTTFLEVKKKNNHGRTKKKRVEIPRDCFLDPWREDGTAPLLSKHTAYAPEDLSCALEVSFTRITLVSKLMNERLTIDSSLRFRNPRTGLEAGLGDAVIIELKRDTLCSSAMQDILSEMRIHPFRISKYCIGTALTSPDVKQNRFKEKIRKLNKII